MPGVCACVCGCVGVPWQLSPTFGGPVNSMVRVSRGPTESKAGEGEDDAPASAAGVHDLLAYATADRVVGLCLLPLDGNPKRSMGLVAHPNKVRVCFGCGVGVVWVS